MDDLHADQRVTSEFASYVPSVRNNRASAEAKQKQMLHLTYRAAAHPDGLRAKAAGTSCAGAQHGWPA